MIEKTKESYYETLEQSSILAVYKEFENRVDFVKKRGITKADRIRRLISNTLGQVTKAQIAEKCPDISVTNRISLHL